MQMILLMLGILFIYISPGSPLQCRDCSSKIDENCLDNPHKVNLVDCTSTSWGLGPSLNQTANVTVTYLCAKCYTKTSGVLIGRGCIPTDFQEGIQIVLKCDFCETDGCNSSPIIGTGIMSIVVPLLASVFSIVYTYYSLYPIITMN